MSVPLFASFDLVAQYMTYSTRGVVFSCKSHPSAHTLTIAHYSSDIMHAFCHNTVVLLPMQWYNYTIIIYTVIIVFIIYHTSYNNVLVL